MTRTNSGKDIDRQIAAEIGVLPEHERRQRAEHAKRAYMLQLATRATRARRVARRVPPPRAAEPECGNTAGAE